MHRLSDHDSDAAVCSKVSNAQIAYSGFRRGSEASHLYALQLRLLIDFHGGRERLCYRALLT